MRKQSKQFQRNRCGGRKAITVSPVTGKKTQYDACKVTHETVNSKTVQLAQAVGLRSLLARFGTFWVPRNVRTSSGGHPSRRTCEQFQADGTVDYTHAPRVVHQYTTSLKATA